MRTCKLGLNLMNVCCKPCEKLLTQNKFKNYKKYYFEKIIITITKQTNTKTNKHKRCKQQRIFNVTN